LSKKRTMNALLICLSVGHLRGIRALGALTLAGALSACAVGPDYQRPTMELGQTYKEVQGWTIAQPGDDRIRGDWWGLFGDASLNQLMAALQASNLSVAQAEAQYREAQATVSSAQSGFFPKVGTAASTTRSGTGSGRSASVRWPD
jgi:outer membrane protein TolC